MSVPLDSAIAHIDSFHLRPNGGAYWESYVDNLGTADRFLLVDGWRTVYAREVESAVVRLELADGSVGWGEANAPILPELVCRIVDQLLAPVLEGRYFANPAAMWDFLYDLQRGRGHHSGYQLDAIAAVDIALWDALARREDLPLAALLVQAPRTDIAVYLSGLRQARRGERADHARGWAARGITGVKLFLNGDFSATCEEVSALQAAVPEIDRWMVDLLWSLETVEEAATTKRALGELGVTWLECPLLPEDVEGHRQLVGRPGAPLALGESFHTHLDLAPWLSPRSLDILQPDVGRTGFTGAWRARNMALAAGVAVTPHMGSGLDVFQAATLQFAAACENDHLCEFQGGLSSRLGDAVDNGWCYSDGGFHLPDRPGLGVDVDVEQLSQFAVR